MQKWEYKMLVGWPTEATLNALSRLGWELITVAVAAGTYRVNDEVRAYLKRPIQDGSK